MDKDLKSLLHYVKNILTIHSSKLEQPTIDCLNEILKPSNGGIFSFKNEKIQFKISRLGDHMTPIDYIIYIVCRLILDIKDYSIIFPSINDDLNSIEQTIKSMNKNELIGVSARIRDKLNKGIHRRNLNFIVHCEEKEPPKHIQKWLGNDEGNPFSKEWTSDILLFAQNIIIDLLTDNEDLIYIVDNEKKYIDYELLIQTELINSLSRLLIHKSNFKKHSDETIDILLNYVKDIQKNIDIFKNTIGIAELSNCMSKAYFYDYVREDIISNNYYKKKPDKLRKMINNLEKERKTKYNENLEILKKKNIISLDQYLGAMLENNPTKLDIMDNLTNMMKDCDGISLRE